MRIFSRFEISFLVVLGVGTLHAALDQPLITSIYQEQSNVVVQVTVPDGVRKVTLESRERVGPGSWAPRAVAHLDQSAVQVEFRLPHDKGLELLRVRADEEDPLPASFYSGQTSFGGSLYGGTDAPPFYSTMGDGTPGPGTTAEDVGTQRTVAESDIWVVRGTRLYFFNQLRGLQIVDLTDADAPALMGTLPLPAAGEKMYLTGERHLVLLARSGCYYGGEGSQVLVVEDRAGTPVVVGGLPVAGYILESRMVGTALYVASQTYRTLASPDGMTWEYGTQVSSFDLSDPANPVRRDTLWYPGYGHVISATDVLLFVVMQDPSNWWQSVVRTIDITAPDGSMHAFETLRLAGRIKDKFKLHYSDQILTSISEDWNAGGARRLITRLETFRLPDPRAAGPMGVAKLGQLELGAGEQLHATRFDGDRVYIVTFFQIDPLWVVSLADPARPRIVGELEVPGWSTFIEPLGDLLVAVGVETNRVAISLFDVTDPSNPLLADRVLLGDNYSYSEANWDEKAFNVFPEQGLILIPYSGYSSDGYATRVQLIDLDGSDLTARGVIEHSMQPRRAALYEDRILSLSGWELLSVDASDRDHPAVRGRLELAWPVDRVFLRDEHLLQVSDSAGWRVEATPFVRVSRADSPETIVGEMKLSELPVIGASLRGDHLYVIQARSFSWWWHPIPLAGGGQDSGHAGDIVLSVIDLSGLPALALAGQVEAQTQTSAWSAQAQVLWPREDLLVLAGSQTFWWGFATDIAFASDALVGMPISPFWGGQNGQLLAFDVKDVTAPVLASEVGVAASDGWWSFSSAYAANGLVYLSHEASEFVPHILVATPSTAGQDARLLYPDGAWVWRHFLNVVDFADPEHPLVRKPVNLPGRLTGISRGGALVYTVGPRWDEEWKTDWREHLSVSAYDGVAAHLVDALPLTANWPKPVHVVGEHVFIGSPGAAEANGSVVPSTLQQWTVTGAGKLEQLGALELSHPAQTLADYDRLLAVQLSDQSVVLVDLTDPLEPAIAGSHQLPGCLWFDLRAADGAAGRGLWIPLGPYGVQSVSVE